MSRHTPPSSAASSLPAGFTRRRLMLAGGLSLVGLGGCSLIPREAQVPMPAWHEPAGAGFTPDTLVVMLPGIHNRPRDFVTEGLVADLRRRRPDVDVLLVDAHMGYYRDRSVLNRLREDVIVPARAQGYRQIWLAGISLGGFGSLLYAARHGQDIDGVLAIAPYLGSDEVIRSIRTQGGPGPWRRSPAALQANEAEQDLWAWLSRPPAGAPPVHLGFGTEDRMSESHRLMASVLPADRVMRVAGGHDWAPWKALWRQWLVQGPLAPMSAV
jgi:pimeloyl-ACP methyl ester carboxylesterase